MAFTILVCIKSVPDMTSGSTLATDGRWISEADIDWRMNPYDACALEAALAIKDHHDPVAVEVLSVGPDHVRPAIRRAMAMGADTGIHLSMTPRGYLPAETVARAIAHFVRGKGYDLILTGAVSEDLMQGITGPMIAAALDRPCAAAAVEIAPDLADRSLTVCCEMEAGMTARIRLALPALVTVQTSTRRPRYPSLSNSLRSRKQAILQVTPLAGTPGASDCPVTGLAAPQPARKCEVITGTPAEKADRLLQMFNVKGWLL